MEQTPLIVQIIPAVITVLGFIVVLGMYLTKVNRNEKDISKLDDRYYILNEKLFQKLDNIYSSLRRNPYTASDSPVALTDKGLEIAEKLNVKKTIENQFDDFYSLVIEKENDNPNPYDIQQKSITVIREQLLNKMTDDEKNKLKTFAFEEGVEVGDFFTMYGVVLRDLIFAKLRIKVSDVDKHDPLNH